MVGTLGWVCVCFWRFFVLFYGVVAVAGEKRCRDSTSSLAGEKDSVSLAARRSDHVADHRLTDRPPSSLSSVLVLAFNGTSVPPNKRREKKEVCEREGKSAKLRHCLQEPVTALLQLPSSLSFLGQRGKEA